MPSKCQNYQVCYQKGYRNMEDANRIFCRCSKSDYLLSMLLDPNGEHKWNTDYCSICPSHWINEGWWLKEGVPKPPLAFEKA
jgi:hypothetical protein